MKMIKFPLDHKIIGVLTVQRDFTEMSTSRLHTGSRDLPVDIVIANGTRATSQPVGTRARNIELPRSIDDPDLHRQVVRIPLNILRLRRIIIGNNTVELPPTASITVSEVSHWEFVHLKNIFFSA